MKCKWCFREPLELTQDGFCNTRCAQYFRVRDEASKLPPLDHHGAVLDPTAKPEHKFAEVDLPSEFQGIVIQKKKDFATRVLAERVRAYKELKQCVSEIKKHLVGGFQDWCHLGLDLAIDDPIVLQVEVIGKSGDVIGKAHRLCDLSGTRNEEERAAKLNSLLFDLPNVLFEVRKLCKKNRSVAFYLKWWGTVKQMTHEEFLADALNPNIVKQDAKTGDVQAS